MFHRFIARLESHWGRYRGIRNLPTIVVAAMAVVYIADLLLAPVFGFYLTGYLRFNRAAIFQGQIWRLITFAAVPPSRGMFFTVMELVFIYFAGNLLQNHWGTLRFNLFYFCGLLGSVIAGLFSGYASSYYLNLSLLLAVAILYPTMQVNIYGVLPLRMKWLALLDLLLLLPGLISDSWGERVAILVSLLNVLLFFSDRLMQHMKEAKRRYEWKKSWRTGNWR